jgi:modulator of FtsH protease
MAERRVDVAAARFDSATLETNKVLKNTYMLLGMTLAFSAITAGVSMALNLPAIMALVFSIIGFVLLFVVQRMADSAKGLPAIFAFTGFMGASLGPLLNVYLAMPGGASLVTQSLAGTAFIFFGLSAYALQSKRDFSFMHGFLYAGPNSCVGSDDRQHFSWYSCSLADHLSSSRNDHVRINFV